MRLTVLVTPPTALPAVLAVPDAASAGTSVLFLQREGGVPKCMDLGYGKGTDFLVFP